VPAVTEKFTLISVHIQLRYDSNIRSPLLSAILAEALGRSC